MMSRIKSAKGFLSNGDESDAIGFQRLEVTDRCFEQFLMNVGHSRFSLLGLVSGQQENLPIPDTEIASERALRPRFSASTSCLSIMRIVLVVVLVLVLEWQTESRTRTRTRTRTIDCSVMFASAALPPTTSGCARPKSVHPQVDGAVVGGWGTRPSSRSYRDWRLAKLSWRHGFHRVPRGRGTPRPRRSRSPGRTDNFGMCPAQIGRNNLP